MEYAQLLDTSTVWIIDNAVNVLVALAVLAGGFILAGFVGRHAADFLPHTRAIDNTIAPLLSHLARYAIMLVTIVVVLGQFGVNTASILAVLGAAGLAIALALQGTLSNMAAGMLPQPLTAEEVIATTSRVRGQFIALLEGILERL